jgi:uncharacterized membrane protein
MQLWLKNRINQLTAILIVFYTVGIVGMLIAPQTFSPLTPLNLLLSAFLLFIPHPEKDLLFYINLLMVFTAAWFLEMIGVTTGTIFGNYTYGEALGPKLNQTPFIIGLNWIIVTYACLHVSNAIAVFFKIKLHEILGALVSAGFMVLLDFLIEPMAPKLDYWSWEGNSIPVQNYTAWFFFGFAFSYWMLKGGLLKPNPMAVRVYVAQFIFFFLLNFMV